MTIQQRIVSITEIKTVTKIINKTKINKLVTF